LEGQGGFLGKGGVQVVEVGLAGMMVSMRRPLGMRRYGLE
jgi:hypothetical protein